MRENMIHVSNDTMLKHQYDAVCKTVLADKYILAWIMKSVIPEYENSTINEIALHYIEGTPEIGSVPVYQDSTNAEFIKGDSTEIKTMTEGTTTFDIRFHALAPDSDGMIELIINIEAQDAFHPGYPLLKRGVFYCSRLLSSQMGHDFGNDDYGKLKKVYSIWICTNPPKNAKNTINRYSIEEHCLFGNRSYPKKDYDLLQVLLICLGEENNTGNKILDLLNMLMSASYSVTEKVETMKEDYQIPFSDGLGKGVNTMCNLSEGVYNKGKVEGITEGIVKFSELLLNLQAQGRFADVQDAITSDEARDKLFREFGLA